MPLSLMATNAIALQFSFLNTILLHLLSICFLLLTFFFTEIPSIDASTAEARKQLSDEKVAFYLDHSGDTLHVATSSGTSLQTDGVQGQVDEPPLRSGGAHDHVAMTGDTILEHYLEFGYSYYDPGPQDRTTCFYQHAGYGYFVCEGSIMVYVTCPGSAPRSESQINADAVDALQSKATDGVNKYQNSALVSKDISAVPAVLMQCCSS